MVTALVRHDLAQLRLSERLADPVAASGQNTDHQDDQHHHGQDAPALSALAALLGRALAPGAGGQSPLSFGLWGNVHGQLSDLCSPDAAPTVADAVGGRSGGRTASTLTTSATPGAVRAASTARASSSGLGRSPLSVATPSRASTRRQSGANSASARSASATCRTTSVSLIKSFWTAAPPAARWQR